VKIGTIHPAQPGEHDHEQRRGQPEGLVLAVLLQQLGEDRDERRRQRRVREEAADHVGDVERDRERVDRAAEAEVLGREDLARQAGDAGEAGEDREDRGVARERAARRRRVGAAVAGVGLGGRAGGAIGVAAHVVAAAVVAWVGTGGARTRGAPPRRRRGTHGAGAVARWSDARHCGRMLRRGAACPPHAASRVAAR
jgi:hypothetical protein